MTKKSVSFAKVVLEIVFIAFAVFLGLLVGQWNEDKKNNKLAEENLSNILTEINENKETLEGYLKIHEKIEEKFNVIIASSDSESYVAQKQADFSYNLELLHNSAWNTAKLTHSISFMDFSLVKNISIMYDFQDEYTLIINEQMKRNIFRPNQYNSKIEYNEFIIQRNILNAITQMEIALIKYYNYTISLIEDSNQIKKID